MNQEKETLHKRGGTGTVLRKTRLLVLFAAAFLITCFSGCSENESGDAQKDTRDNAAVETSESMNQNEEKDFQQEKTYESILADYTEKLRSRTPELIEEYKEEAASNDGGLNGLAEIANKKVESLAEVVNKGVEEMAKIMYTTGSGKYEEYQDWATKLYDVYEEEASKIYDAYMNSAM